MHVIKFLSVAVLSFGVSFGASHAQGFNGPAETPPASFKGKQYVDSRGCLFIRAGFGGQTRWVPRVSRSRKQVCQASGGARSAARPASATTRTARAQQGTIVDPLAGAPIIGGPSAGKVKTTTTRTAAAAATQPAPRVVRQAQPAPQRATRVVRKVKPSTTTRLVRQQQQQQRTARRTQPQTVTRVVREPRTTTQTRGVRQARTTTRAVRQQAGNCANASAFSNRFINSGARCGPQEVSSADGAGPQSANTRVGPASAPRVIAEARTITPPKGYKTAWKDDRLNPYRGVSRVSGKQEMRLVWSDTVPRHLIDPATGKPVGKRRLGLFGF